MDESLADGRVIRIFVVGDDPRSLRHVELDNWTGLAVTGQPAFFKRALKSEELRRSCVYLLIQSGGEDDLPRLYIGESDDFSKRYPNSAFPLDFDIFIIFTSKDDNLTRAHVKWLERRLWEMLSENLGQVSVANSNKPTGSNLPKPDKAMMATYLKNMIYVLEALGWDLFTRAERNVSAAATTGTDEDEIVQATDTVFFTHLPKHDGKLAHLEQTTSGYMLKRGSHISAKTTESLPANVRRLREQLIREGKLVSRGDALELLQDISFAKPSPASALVKGRSSTGHGDWLREGDKVPLGKVVLEEGTT